MANAIGKLIYNGAEYFFESDEEFASAQQRVNNIAGRNESMLIEVQTNMGPVSLLVSREIPIAFMPLESYSIEDSVL